MASMRSLAGIGVLCVAVASTLAAQAPVAISAEADRAEMVRRLGIAGLLPGPSGDPKSANPANYEESKATPFAELPDLLTTNHGRPVTTPALWWRVRRPEIAEALSREVYGRVPAGVPPVRWRLIAESRETISAAVRVRKLVGHVEARADIGRAVDIRMTVVTPLAIAGRVPLLVMLGRDGPSGSRETDLVAAGWGYARLDTESIQPDNGEGLRQGIIGLVNRGGPRKPDDWGALRAWSWGASRAFDWLSRDPAVDPRRIGVEGVSRYGKAALVAAAFDQRFAAMLVGSSGKGGTTLLRRNFGEAVATLATGEYYWMAGNFLRYDAVSGPGARTVADLPVDSHALIALVAPRPTFISYGVPEAGDAHWLDHRGSLMAAVAAGRVWRLLGARDLGLGDDWRGARLPPVGEGLLDGALAWRQHDGGHTDAPNMRTFIRWADCRLSPPGPPPARAGCDRGSPVPTGR